jgi:hypothetical protein
MLLLMSIKGATHWTVSPTLIYTVLSLFFGYEYVWNLRDWPSLKQTCQVDLGCVLHSPLVHRLYSGRSVSYLCVVSWLRSEWDAASVECRFFANWDFPRIFCIINLAGR